MKITSKDTRISHRIGIDLGGTKTEIIVLDNNGHTVYQKRYPTPRINDPHGHDNNHLSLSTDQLNAEYQTLVDHLKSMVCQAIDQINQEAPTKARFSLGIGIPGAISPATGLIKNANTTCLIGQPLQRDLHQHIQDPQLLHPIRIANDANCFALSEAVDGSGQDSLSVFGVIIGTGVGGGWVFDKKLMIGANAIGGEWGHNPLPYLSADDSLLDCYCGQSGCIETFLSGPGLTHHAELMRRTLSPAAIKSSAAIEPPAASKILQTTQKNAAEWWQSYQSGDSLAQQVIEQYCQRLAKSLASVINIMDPDMIILGGGLSKMDILYQRVPELWQQWVFSDEVATRLAPPSHGDASGVRGAAWLGSTIN